MGNRLTVKFMSDFKGTVSFDKSKLTLTDKSETLDTWVRLGSGWKLKTVVQTKAETQAYQKQ